MIDALRFLYKPSQNPTQLLIHLNSTISKLTRVHRHSDALLLFSRIHSSPHLSPDHYTLAGALTAAASLPDSAAAGGAQIHSLALRSGLLSFPHVANPLISFYAKSHGSLPARRLFDDIPIPDSYSCTTILSAYCKDGKFINALRLFDEMPQRDTPVWNAMITGSIQHGCMELSLELFVRMRRAGVAHDRYSFTSIISLCGSPELGGLGKQVHSLVVRTGWFSSGVSVVSALVTMYMDLGLVREACDLFGEAVVYDEITYNALIAGLARWGRGEEAIMVLKEMRGEACLWPTELTFVSAFSACWSKKVGGSIHAQAIRNGFEASVLMGNAAVKMYADCGDLVSAWQVFDEIGDKDIVSWNSMISGYSQGGYDKLAVDIYHHMQMNGIEADYFTYGSLITCLRTEEHAKMIHAVVFQNGLITCTEVSNALLSTYARCGNFDSASQVFGEMILRNLVSWNSIISGCLLNGLPIRGLESFSRLMISGLQPNFSTLSCVLSTCASMSDITHGKEVHGYVIRSGFSNEASLGNSLISLYAKCGYLDYSLKVFSRMLQRDIVSWNAIIAAYAQNGDGLRAIQCFNELQTSGNIPDNITFTIVLSACSHAGLVEEGRVIFSSMVKDYGVKPGVDHYSCVIDLLGRGGYLEEAEKLINKMPYKADPRIWWSLLSACSTHGNVRLGRVVAKFLLEAEPDNPAIYVLLSNIIAADGQWKEASIVREQMSQNEVVKNPGFTWIESENCLAAFTM